MALAQIPFPYAIRIAYHRTLVVIVVEVAFARGYLYLSWEYKRVYCTISTERCVEAKDD